MKFKEIKPGMVIHCPKEEDARALLKHLGSNGYVVPTLPKKYNNETDCFKLYDCGHDVKIVSYGTRQHYLQSTENNTIIEFSDLIEPEPRFKVGDKVKVRKMSETVPSSCIARNYEGTEFTIMTVTKCNDGFLYAAKDNPYNWLEDALEPVNDSLINSDTDSPMSAVEVLEWLKYAGKATLIKVFGRIEIDGILLKYSPEEVVANITAYEAAKKAPKPVELEEGYWYKVYALNAGMIAEKRLWNCSWNEADLSARKIAYDYTKEHGCECSTEICYICRVKEGES